MADPDAADPRVEMLLIAGWRRVDGKWWPPAGRAFIACQRGSRARRSGYSLEDAYALCELIEHATQHLKTQHVKRNAP